MTTTTTSSSIFFVLIAFLGVSDTLAYECSIGFFNKTYVVSVETKELCDYAIYHATMIVVCPIVSLLFFFYAFLFIILKCDLERAEFFAKIALIMLFLSFGFEFGWALMFLGGFMFFVFNASRNCVHRCLARYQSYAPPRRFQWVNFRLSHSVQIQPVVEVVIVPYNYPQNDDDLPSAPPLELLADSPSAPPVGYLTDLHLGPTPVPECARIFPVDECPICFEGVDVNKAWCKLGCGHMFHADCMNEHIAFSGNINCPICRRYVGPR